MNKVKVINKSAFNLPKYETEGSSGMDLRVDLNNEPKIRGTVLFKYKKGEIYKVTMHPNSRTIFFTNIYVQLPKNYEFQIRPRSGHSFKVGLDVVLGTIDSDYTGNIGIICKNNTNHPIVISHGDRVAQMVLKKVDKFEWEEVELLDETERGSGGFGHTGEN